MSVVMTLRLAVDPKRFQETANQNADQLLAIAEQAKQRGVLRHAFFGSDAEVMVVDEWPDEQSFLGFFEAAGPEIADLMGRAGLANQPQPEFWRLLDTPDKM